MYPVEVKQLRSLHGTLNSLVGRGSEASVGVCTYLGSRKDKYYLGIKESMPCSQFTQSITECFSFSLISLSWCVVNVTGNVLIKHIKATTTIPGTIPS